MSDTPTLSDTGEPTAIIPEAPIRFGRWYARWERNFESFKIGNYAIQVVISVEIHHGAAFFKSLAVA
jgi:hypothetical protein